MAIELLVRTTDGSAGRMRGDIVSVKQVPHKGWAKGEDLPNYLIIRIGDINKDDFKEYEGRHLHINSLDINSASKRSKYRLDLDSLPRNHSEKRPHLVFTKQTVFSNAILRAFT